MLDIFLDLSIFIFKVLKAFRKLHRHYEYQESVHPLIKCQKYFNNLVVKSTRVQINPWEHEKSNGDLILLIKVFWQIHLKRQSGARSSHQCRAWGRVCCTQPYPGFQEIVSRLKLMTSKSHDNHFTVTSKLLFASNNFNKYTLKVKIDKDHF